MKGKVFVEVKWYDSWSQNEGYTHYDNFYSDSEAWEFARRVEELGLGQAYVIPVSLANARKAELKNR